MSKVSEKSNNKKEIVIKIHLDAEKMSDILSAYLATDEGKREMIKIVKDAKKNGDL